MITRTLSRWLLAVVFAAIFLVTINLSVTGTPAQAHIATAPANQIRYVATAGSDIGNNCSNGNLPCATVQYAVDAADSGDEIRVAGGIYTDIHARESVTQVVYISKPLILRGGYTTTNWTHSDPATYPTVLDAESRGRVLTIIDTLSATIEGFNLTGGNAAGLGGALTFNNADAGGGVLVISASVTLTNNLIFSNTAPLGGGIYIDQDFRYPLPPSMLYSNTIAHNAASSGGGVNVEGVQTIFHNNLITGNVAASNVGGGVRVEGVNFSLFQDNHFMNNEARGGGGLWLDESYAVTVRHNTFSGNHAHSQLPGKGGGLVVYGISNLVERNLIISNSAESGGGGIYAYSGGSNALVNNVVAQNSSGTNVGAGIYIEGYAVSQMAHTTLVGNGQGSGLYCQQPIQLRNMIIGGFGTGIQYAGSTTFGVDGVLWYSNTQNTSGAIAVTHAYTGTPDFVNQTITDYHLRASSPAIDTGINAGITVDLDGRLRPFGSGYDLGAYEFSAGPRYVATTGSDSGNDCLNQASPCATVQHAIDVAKDGEEVFIASGLYTQSTTLNKPVSLTGETRDTTIIHAITGQRVLTVTGATISTSVVISGLMFTGGSADIGGGILITDTAQPLIRDSILISNTAETGGGLYSNSALTLLNTDFISNTATFVGGGVHAYGEPVIITGGRFEGNTASANGGLSAGSVTLTDVDFIRNTASSGTGGAYIGHGTISGGRFIENTAGGGAGGLLVTGGAVVTGTQFLSNTAAGTGGGLLAYVGTLTIMNADFESNYAGGSGGGVAVSDTSITLMNTRFISNTANNEGGGVFVNSNYAARISGGRFERNTATHGGGGVYVGFATITDTQFISNTNTGEGFEGSGGSGLYSRYDPTIIDSRFVGNQCVNCKGGGFHTLGNSIISGTTFIDNSATNGGGGAYTSRASIENTRFQRNVSANAGGGLNAGEVSVRNSQFISNTSGRSGGGSFTSGTITLSDTDFISNTALHAGGGIYSVGSVILSRTNVIGNRSGWGGGGGIFLDRDANLTLADVTVIGNTTEYFDGGGGVQVQSGAVKVTNSRFESNRCDCFGGGMQVTGGYTKTLIISQTVFVDNEAASGGGLVSIYGPVTIIDSQFISNTAHTYSGGGFHSNQGSVELIGSQFLSNTAQLAGGGLYAYPYLPDALVRMTGTHFLYNRAIDTRTSYGSGGGAAVMGTVIISDGLFEGNVAHGQQGGGLSATYLIVTETTFIRNSIASSFGHGGGAAAGVATIIGSRFEENMTGGPGGGFSSQWATISDARFISNTASGLGGGFYQYGDGRSSIVNTLFARNMAMGAGGAAIATTSIGDLDVTQVTIADTISNPKAAVAVLSGTLNLTNTIIANHAIGISNTAGMVYEDYNLFFNVITYTADMTSGGHSLVGDPRFVDPLSGDYHLQFGSSAIDRGVNASLYTDLDDHPRPVGLGFDIGAYEFQGIRYVWLPLILK